jgi:hypothetical protein
MVLELFMVSNLWDMDLYIWIYGYLWDDFEKPGFMG